MKKKAATLLAALTLSLSAAGVQAEQSKAEEYRQIFASGNFYLEYEDKYLTQIIGAQDGKRILARNSVGLPVFLAPCSAGRTKRRKFFTRTENCTSKR